MWRASVFMFLLLNMIMQVNGSVDEMKASAPEKKVTTERVEGTDSVSASDPDSSRFLGNLLVIPMDGSHWVGIKALAQEMGRRGHRVTVVMPGVTFLMGPGKHYDTVTFPVPYDKAYIDSLMASNKEALKKSTEGFMEKIRRHFSEMEKFRGFVQTAAESLLFNASLISHLAQQGFDAVLTDPMVPTGSLVARKLGLPTINMLRGVPCSLDMKSAGCPSPPSYVPRMVTGYTDKMNFWERTINTLVALLEPLLCPLISPVPYSHFDHMASEFLGEEVGIADVLSESAVWLLRTNLVFDTPRPLMPNIILVGGINCNIRNPLPEDLKSWVSGEHGFIMFTFGSMMSDLPEETTSVFIEAFRQIPQKVIWRYTGPVPDNVPENVKMMDWVPQNDLLAHPGARAFITHAGSHGLYEGLCHAVPMVMIPIFGDQPGNAEKMASKGAGVVLDILQITTETLLQGLNDVINDTRYKENMQKLSALHKDRPMEPLDLSVYWTEFVMKHKGVKHLRAAVHDLNWFQYFCLDVIALLATVMLVSAALTAKCFKLCLRKLGRKRKQD